MESQRKAFFQSLARFFLFIGIAFLIASSGLIFSPNYAFLSLIFMAFAIALILGSLIFTTKIIEERVERVEQTAPKDDYTKLKDSILKFPPSFYYLDSSLIQQLDSILTQGKFRHKEIEKTSTLSNGEASGSIPGAASARVQKKKEDETVTTTGYKSTDSLSCINIIKALLESKQVVLDLLDVNTIPEYSKIQYEMQKLDYQTVFNSIWMKNWKDLYAKNIADDVNGQELGKIIATEFNNYITDFEQSLVNDAIIRLFSTKIQQNLGSYAIIKGDFVLDHFGVTMSFTINSPITGMKSKNDKKVSIKFSGLQTNFNETFLLTIPTTKKFFGTCLVTIFDWDEENLSLNLLPIAVFS